MAAYKNEQTLGELTHVVPLSSGRELTRAKLYR